jgi:hypothetical protein
MAQISDLDGYDKRHCCESDLSEFAGGDDGTRIRDLMRESKKGDNGSDKVQSGIPTTTHSLSAKANHIIDKRTCKFLEPVRHAVRGNNHVTL